MALTLQDVKDAIASGDPLTYEQSVAILNFGSIKLRDLTRQLAGLKGEKYEAPFGERQAEAPSEILQEIKSLGVQIANKQRQINDHNQVVTAELSDALKEASAGLGL